MAKIHDITGKRFGRLTVIELAPKTKTIESRRWICKCDCGTVKAYWGYVLREGQTKSCGCFKNERIFEINKTHGMSKTPIYSVWASMKQRCYDKNAESYPVYGGRGITVCDRWLNSFENFYEDMGDKPKGYSIERINVNGNYEPDNCKCIPKNQQQNNTTRSRYIETPWGILHFSEAARRIGINQASLRDRIKWGWTGEKLFSPRNEKYNRFKSGVD